MEDLASFVVDLALRRGCAYAEARVQSDFGDTAMVKNGNLEVVAYVRMLGLGVRVIKSGALGFASTNRLDRRSLSRLVESAVSMASASSSTLKKPVSLAPMKTENREWTVNEKKKTRSVSHEERLGVLQDVEKALSEPEVGVRLPGRMLVLTNWETDKIYLNSEGSRVRSLVPRISFYYMLTALEGSRGTAQRFNQFGGSGGWELVESWSLPESVSEEARILGRVLREAKAPPRGEIDVVLGSEVVGIVCHESCGHPSEADRILGREAAQAGESFMKPEMIGTRLGSDAVTIVDDPTLQGSYGHYLYDDEGVRASRRELMKSGVLNTFLHNRETAAELGVESNGAARAMGYSLEPIIRMANTFMLPGDHSLDELLQDVSNGVYIKSFMEWNIDDRRFNQRYVGLEAYAIKRGKLGEMVKNPTIELTTTGLFNSVDAVSKNLAFSAAMCGKGDPEQDAPVWTGGPEIRLRKVRLGGLTR